MVKMVPHRIIAEQFRDDPVIKLLEEQDGESYIDSANNFVEIACEKFYILPKSLSDLPALRLLEKHGLFDFESENNVVYLPIDPIQAFKLGKSAYTDAPIESYTEGARKIIRRIKGVGFFSKARRGSKTALSQIVAEISNLQRFMREGLESGKLHAAYRTEKSQYSPSFMRR